MKIINKFSLLLFSVLIISCSQSKKIPTPEELGISSDTLELAAERMQSYIDNGELPGIAVKVIKNGVVVQDRQFGLADIDANLAPGGNTIYRIFSMSKPVTAVALMTLFEDGKFELDDPVSDFIPEFSETPVYTPEGKGFTLEIQKEPITIRHLLTHTSGIVYGWTPGSYVDSLYTVTGAINWDEPIGDKVRLIASLPLKFQPGTAWEYGLSIDVAGYLVEVMSGLPFDEYLSNEIFKPLKMDDTGFSVPGEKIDRFSALYTKGKDGALKNANNLLGETTDDIFLKPAVTFSGGGGLVSTINDYEKFCRMLLNGGELDGVRILEESTVRTIMSDQLPLEVDYSEKYGYGLGGKVNLKTGEYSWSGAASTSFFIDRSNNLIGLEFTQLMPSNYTYAIEHKDLVKRAIITTSK